MITVTAISNAVYKSANNNIVDVDIMTDEYGLIPTTIIVDDNDQEPHVLQIKEWLLTATIAPFVPTPPETPAEANIRKDAQVESEFTPALLAIINVLDPANAGVLIAQAKAARKLEL